MTDDLFGGLHRNAQRVNCRSVGTQPGPAAGGDGWQIVATLPRSKLRSGAFAVQVTGYVDAVAWSGSSPVRGQVQVCLGTAAGTKHPRHYANWGIVGSWHSNEFRGHPFSFLFVCTASVIDELYGSSWANTDDLVLWARSYTNGDVQNYAPTFDVSNVSWLFWNLGVVPAGYQKTDQYYPGTGAPAIPAPGAPVQRLLSAGPWAVGQTWLHMVCVWYAPQGPAGCLQVQHGRVTNGTFATFGAKLGEAGRWGSRLRGSYSAAQNENPQLSLGGFWFETIPASSSYRLAFSAGDAAPSTAEASRIFRYRVVSIRVDGLPDWWGYHLSNGDPLLLAGSFQTAYPNNRVFAQPPPRGYRYSDAVVMAHATAQNGFTVPQQRSYSMALQTNLLTPLWLSDAYVHSKDPAEGVPVQGFAIDSLGEQDDQVLYAVGLYRLNVATAGVEAIGEFYICRFWMLSDPSVAIVAPGVPGSPIELTPNSEGVSIVAQADLPTQPHNAVRESADREQEAIRGSTGYVRRWPMGSVTRRRWVLTWARLRPAEFAALSTFLRSNTTFRWRPPEDSANCAVGCLERPRSTLDDARQLWNVELAVCELVWIDP